MAHFAELDNNNIVLRVIVVDTKDTSDANGIEKEHIGVAFCESLLGGRWVQTSYNNNFRKVFAGIGFKYDETLDAFIPPKPFPSWTLNQNTAYWEAPVPMPNDNKIYSWNENIKQWEIVNPTTI